MANQEETKNEVSRLNLPAETEPAKEYVLNFMTSDENEAEFTVIMNSSWPRREIKEIASMMKLYPDLFMTIIRNKNGSRRMQQLFTVCDEEADGDFCSAILSHLVPLMTDRCTFPTVLHAMRVFAQEPKKRLYDSTGESVVEIACVEAGCIGILRILNCGHQENKNRLLAGIGVNAFDLSKDTHGSLVIESVLRWNDARVVRGPLFASLHGRCVELSFTKPGSDVVQQLLDTSLDSMLMVVWEIFGCRRDVFKRLATDVHGSHVVHKALTVTLEKDPVLLYTPLETMLLPLRTDLLHSGRHAILEVLGLRTVVRYN